MRNNASILSSASYLPKQIMANKDLERDLELDKDYIVSRTGIKERRTFKDESLPEIYSRVATNAMSNSKITSIDSLVIGKDTEHRDISGVYDAIAKSLGESGISIPQSYKEVSNCPGSVSAIGKESRRIQRGEINNSLIVSASKLTELINKKDSGTSILWGDGAGAILLGQSKSPGRIYFTEQKRLDLDYLNMKQDIDGSQYGEMNGRGVTSYVLKIVPEIIKQASRESEIDLEDINHFVFHQGNERLMDSVAKRLSIPDSKIFKNIQKYGNTGIASTLIAYDELSRSGRIKKGDCFAFVGFGKGNDTGMKSNIAIFRK